MSTRKAGNEPPAWFSNVRYWILRSYRAIEDHHDGIEVFLIIATIFIATILFFETKRQANIANDALTYQRLKDSADGKYQRGKDSINLAFAESSNVYTRRSLETASKTADATERSAKATRQTVEITERVAKIQMQPELRVDPAPSDLKTGKRFPVKITIENIGPKAALNWRTSTLMLLMPTPRISDFFLLSPKPTPSPNMLPRNSPVEIETSLPDNLSVGDSIAVGNGSLVICLQLNALYSDAWGEPQILRFFYTYSFYRKTFIFYLPAEGAK